MQPELEKWIADHTRELYAQRQSGGGPIVWAIPVDDLRALLEGKVLCDAEPVAHIFPDDCEIMETSESSCVAYSVAMGDPDRGETVPLYKAAGGVGGETLCDECSQPSGQTTGPYCVTCNRTNGG